MNPRPCILVTAPILHPDAIALLAPFHVIQTEAKVTEDELEAICRDASPVAILARYGLFTERVLRASPALKVISRHGVGLDAIDTAAAGRLGVAVEAALGSNSQAVAELAIGLVLACARRLPWLDARVKQGYWDKEGYAGLELSGRTLGIVGCGSIGSRVARIGHAFGMHVQVCDPYLPAQSLPEFAVQRELDALLAEADVVSLHCPLNDETRNLLDRARISALRPGTIVVNTARAGLFDEAAMRERLIQGDLMLGLDCFAQEPLGDDSDWCRVPHAVLTPHIGGTTDGGMRGMGVGAARNILKHLE